MGDEEIKEELSETGAGKIPVAGIGASAGGVGPLLKFFSQVQADSGFAYVVILHLSSDHESSLPGLIQSHTAIPVSQVTETMKVEANHVYVIPPSKYLALTDGVIYVTEPERYRGSHTSIDLFFRTLASAYGKEAVAILLSGTGADGTLGLGRIKEEGGFVIAQDPDEAEYPDMPRNAINSGRVDLVMRVAEMPAKLWSLQDGARRLQVPIEEEEPESEFDENSLREILTLLRLRTGNDFTQYKRPTVLRRIARRMQVHGHTEMRDYAAFMRENTEEITALLQDLLITVTNFFRDHEAFERLATSVVPQLFVDRSGSGQVRVWSAGCATGEEAYSIAMLLMEHASRANATQTIQVFATDIDQRAIAEARDCHYPASIELDVSPERLQRFFHREGDRYEIKKELREVVMFAPHNITRDPPFSRLDLISCRNLLIYLNRALQERVLEIFHFALRPGGFLFLGASESAEIISGLFEPVDKKRRIYRRRSIAGQNVPSVNLTPGGWQFKMPDTSSARGADGGVSPGQLHEEIVEQLSPPSVLINDEYDIMHVSARAGEYLRMPAGEPSRNLLKLIDPELRLEMRAALLEARSRPTDEIPKPRRLRVETGGAAHQIDLTVRAAGATPAAGRGCLLVVFAPVSDAAAPDEPQKPIGDGFKVVHELEQELQRTKDRLRITVEQYETTTEELRASNEELQAINEELRSASEELETSKEELQSVNEELVTVNQEYREKMEELARANSDLQNLMASTEIGTIFLDRSLQIKRYTPSARRVFNITAGDVGRPLHHFTHKFDYQSLNEDAASVLQTLQPIEREVVSIDGQFFQLRLAPYRTMDDKIDGVVLTFVDMTARKQSEDILRRQAYTLREQTAIVNLAYVMVLDENWRILVWSTGCERFYGFTVEEAIGKLSYELLRTEFTQSREAITEQLRRTGQWQGEFVNRAKGGEAIIVASHLILHQRETGQPSVMLMVNNDVTASRLAEEALRSADRNKDRFLATLAHELRNPLAAMLNSTMILQESGVAPRAVELARGVLQRQLHHLMRLVDDLLDVERLIHGKIKLDKGPVLLAAMIDGAVETCRQPLENKGHQLKVTLPSEPLTIDGDLTRLSQIVANLLHNSIKYTPSGGTISITAEHLGLEVVIHVRDSGIGIEPDALSTIFELYSQRNISGENGQQGLGIGLSLVRELTEMHGGSVTVASEGPGKGSEFVLRLPLRIAAPVSRRSDRTADGNADGNAARTDKSSEGSGKRVLLVEDNKDVADATAEVLRHAGHELAVAYDAHHALELIEEFKPQVAVLDIGLPEMDGYALARRIHQRRPEIVLLALSGWSSNDNDPRAADAHFTRYFTKPIDPSTLGRFIVEL